MQDVLIRQKAENRHLTERGRMEDWGGGTGVTTPTKVTRGVWGSLQGTFTLSGEAASQEQKRRNQRDPGEEEGKSNGSPGDGQELTLHFDGRAGLAGRTPGQMRSPATGRGEGSPGLTGRHTGRASAERSDRSQPCRKCAGLPDKRPGWDREQAKTYGMTSVLLVQEPEPLLSHRTRKTICVILSQFSQGCYRT